MAEGHPRADLEQPLGLGGVRRLDSDPETFGRSPQQHRVTEGLRRRKQQQLLGLGRHGREPPAEALLDAPRQRLRAREPEAARQLRRRQPTRQLQQRQRVAPRFGDDPVAHPLVQRPADHRGQERARITITEALDHQFRQPSQPLRFGGWADGEHQRDRLREQAARDELERLHRRVIEPLRIFHHADQWPVIGGVRDHAE